MTAVIIGRFQVPFLHPGHLHLIASALRECESVLIILGSKRDIDERNPYSVIRRKGTISQIFPQVMVASVWDNESDEVWSNEVDQIIEDHCGQQGAILYHSRDSFRSVYTGRYPSKEILELPGFSGTEIRKNA